MGLEFTYAAFFDLINDRPVGMGPGAIPYITIFNYGQIHGLEGEDLYEFILLIQAMDQEFLAYAKEQTPAPPEPPKNGNAGS